MLGWSKVYELESEVEREEVLLVVGKPNRYEINDLLHGETDVKVDPKEISAILSPKRLNTLVVSIFGW